MLAVWQLRSLDDREELLRVTRAVVVADAGDALAFALALRDPQARPMAALGVALAGPATLIGGWLGSSLSRRD